MSNNNKNATDLGFNKIICSLSARLGSKKDTRPGSFIVLKESSRLTYF
jgi:hypothetical protein